MAVDHVEVETHVNASPESVWRVIAAIDRYPAVFGAISTLTRVSGTGYGLGVSWRESRRVLGRNMNVDVRVSEMAQYEYTVHLSEFDEGIAAYRYELTPSGSGTQLKLSSDVLENRQGKLRARFADALGLVTDKVIRDILKADLSDIAAAARV